MFAKPATLSDDQGAVAKWSENVHAFTLNLRTVRLDHEMRPGLQQLACSMQDAGLCTLNVDLDETWTRSTLASDEGIECVGIYGSVRLEAHVELLDLNQGGDLWIQREVAAHPRDADRVEVEARDRLSRETCQDHRVVGVVSADIEAATSRRCQASYMTGDLYLSDPQVDVDRRVRVYLHA